MWTRMLGGGSSERSWEDHSCRVGSHGRGWLCGICGGRKGGGMGASRDHRDQSTIRALSFPQQKSLWQLFEVQFTLCPQSGECQGTWVRRFGQCCLWAQEADSIFGTPYKTRVQEKLLYFLPTICHPRVSTKSLSGLATPLCQQSGGNSYAMVIASFLKPASYLVSNFQD